MQSIRSIFAVSSLAALYGCPEITANITLESKTADIEIDFEGECTGSGSDTNEHGTTNWVKNTLEATCSVDVDWDGVLVPTDEVRQEIEEESDGHVNEVSITRLKVTLHSVQLLDKNNAPAAPPRFDRFTASTKLSGNEVYAIDDANVAQLLSAPLEVELVAPHPILSALDAALNDGAPLPATADVLIGVPLDALAPLQAPEVNKHRVVFTHDFEIEANATLGL